MWSRTPANTINAPYIVVYHDRQTKFVLIITTHEYNQTKSDYDKQVAYARNGVKEILYILHVT